MAIGEFSGGKSVKRKDHNNNRTSESHLLPYKIGIKMAHSVLGTAHYHLSFTEDIAL